MQVKIIRQRENEYFALVRRDSEEEWVNSFLANSVNKLFCLCVRTFLPNPPSPVARFCTLFVNTPSPPWSVRTL